VTPVEGSTVAVRVSGWSTESGRWRGVSPRGRGRLSLRMGLKSRSHHRLCVALCMSLVSVVLVVSRAVPARASASFRITLENTGPSAFTLVTLGFDAPPTAPGANIEWYVGNASDPTNRGAFVSGGSPVSGSNPIGPGEIATTMPLAFDVGTTLDADWVESFGNGFGYVVSTGWPNHPTPDDAWQPEIVPDQTVLTFDFPHAGVEGGRLEGVFRFLSDSTPPPPPPPGDTTLSVTPTGGLPGTVFAVSWMLDGRAYASRHRPGTERFSRWPYGARDDGRSDGGDVPGTRRRLERQRDLHRERELWRRFGGVNEGPSTCG
jgi:hypothetical protein